jgi:hypothetical protein
MIWQFHAVPACKLPVMWSHGVFPRCSTLNGLKKVLSASGTFRGDTDLGNIIDASGSFSRRHTQVTTACGKLIVMYILL